MNWRGHIATSLSVEPDDFDYAPFSQRGSLGVWEQLNNPGFNPIEFDGIRKQAGLNSFILTASRWIAATHEIGLISKAGRYGGTYAHKDIALCQLEPPKGGKA